MEFIIKTNDEVAGLDMTEALSLAGIQHTILSKQRDSRAELDILQARLIATENALAAAGELLSMSSMGDVYSDDGGYIYCSSCSKMYPHHKQTCEYRQAKARWDAARAALKP